jgi:hypothetical protein
MNPTWDESAWETLAGELDIWFAQGRQATFWWRDDDAGRPHPGLERLMSLATTTGLPLGLAVVPAWLAPEVTEALQAAPAQVAVLQHGYAHANHETESQPGERKVRPAECGSARPVPVVLDELRKGAEILRGALGSRLLPVCVPPWNRIAPGVTAGLRQAGYQTVSAFGARSAAEPVPGLLQVNCHVDPILWRDGKRFAGPGATLGKIRTHLANRRQGRVDPSEPTGILTHHRDMDPTCWVFIEELLRRLPSHPAVTFPPLPSLLMPDGIGPKSRG